MSQGEGVRDVRWPAHRFYWALLDGALIPRTARRPLEQLSYLLEPLVPEPLDALHAIYVRLKGAPGGKRYLACALPRRELIETAELASAVTLAPDALPEFITGAVDPGRLNLLTGAFVPASVRRARARWLWKAAGLLVVCALLLALGLERRIAAAKRQVEERRAALSEVYRRALGDEVSRSSLPPALSLLAELRTLRQTRRVEDSPVTPETDTAVTLSTLLARWPSAVDVSTELIQVTPASIHLEGTLPSSPLVESFSLAFADLPGWRLEQPSIETLPTGVRTSMEWKRAHGEGRP